MKRRTGNKKVARAIALALASVVAVTSVPTSITAEETVLIQVNEQTTQETTPQVTVESITQAANDRADNAESLTGEFSVNEETKVAEGSGDIGSKAAEAWNDINAAQKVQTDLSTDASTVETTVDKLADNNSGLNTEDGTGMVKDAETKEANLENTVGVTITINVSEEVEIADNGLNQKVEDANNAIDAVDQAKASAYSSLTGFQTETIGTKDKEGSVKQLVEDASDKKKTADTDTTTAENQAKTITSLDEETENALTQIKNELNNAINSEDLSTAVSGAAKATADAAELADKKLTVVQNAYNTAKGAADEAEAHTGEYNRQQMVNLANTAQQAATGAKQAAEAADQAAKEAQGKEEAAQKKVDDAVGALKLAENKAVNVLLKYQSRIKEINGYIETANGSRATANTAMDKANTAIQTALDLFYDTEVTSETTTEKENSKIVALRSAIKAANEAIELVTGLVPQEGDSDHPLTVAETAQADAYELLEGQLAALTEAKGVYDKAHEENGTAKVNRDKAAQLLNEIDEYLDKTINQLVDYKSLMDLTEKDIKDLKALLTSGKTYSQLEEDVNTTTTKLGNEKAALEAGGDKRDSDTIYGDYDARVKNVENLKGLADTAQTTLDSDIAAMKEKYVQDPENLNEFLKDKDGNYITNDEYNRLVTDSKEKKPDTYDYRLNGAQDGKVITETEADYSEKDKDGKTVLYKIVGNGSVAPGQTTKPKNWNDKTDTATLLESSGIKNAGENLFVTNTYKYKQTNVKDSRNVSGIYNYPQNKNTVETFGSSKYAPMPSRKQY